MYKAEGIFLFAHGENGELYKKTIEYCRPGHNISWKTRGNTKTLLI